jgi:hypothetical protein
MSDNGNSDQISPSKKAATFSPVLPDEEHAKEPAKTEPISLVREAVSIAQQMSDDVKALKQKLNNDINNQSGKPRKAAASKSKPRSELKASIDELR